VQTVRIDISVVTVLVVVDVDVLVVDDVDVLVVLVVLVLVVVVVEVLVVVIVEVLVVVVVLELVLVVVDVLVEVVYTMWQFEQSVQSVPAAHVPALVNDGSLQMPFLLNMHESAACPTCGCVGGIVTGFVVNVVSEVAVDGVDVVGT